MRRRARRSTQPLERMGTGTSTREVLSRALAAALAVVVLAPLSYTAAIAGSNYAKLAVRLLTRDVSGLVMLIVLLVAIAALTSLWRISVPFILYGPIAFSRIGTRWWCVVAAGGVLVALGALLFLIAMNQKGVNWFGPFFALGTVGLAGLLAVLPASHLWVERQRYMRSNTSLERTREG